MDGRYPPICYRKLTTNLDITITKRCDIFVIHRELETRSPRSRKGTEHRPNPSIYSNSFIAPGKSLRSNKTRIESCLASTPSRRSWRQRKRPEESLRKPDNKPSK